MELKARILRSKKAVSPRTAGWKSLSPWRGFNGHPADGEGYIQWPKQEAFPIAEKYHPAWGKLSYGARKLMTRNIHQVLGLDLNTPADFIVYWHPEGRPGGTGQALRVAIDRGERESTAVRFGQTAGTRNAAGTGNGIAAGRVDSHAGGRDGRVQRDDTPG